MVRSKKRRPQGAGSVRQLPSGRWQARYRDEHGSMKAAPVTFDTKLDAAAWLADYVEGVAVAPQRRADPTLSAYAAGWLATRELKPRTRAHYRRLLDNGILPALGNLRMSRITPDKVRAWYSMLNPDTPTLRAHTYALLRTIMTTAVSEDVVETNPCRIRAAGTSKTRHRPQVASLPEIEAIAAAMPPRYRAMVLLAAWCGLRFGELAELRRGDVDLAKRKLRVSRGVTRADGQVVIGTPKSYAGLRTVSVPPHLVPFISDHLTTHVGREPGALLFPSSGDATANMRSSTLDWVWRKARAEVGRPDLRFHDLRHTGATLAAATGATLADLMSRLGHSTPAAALRYQHAVEDRDEAIAEALSGFAEAKVVPLRQRSS